MNTALVDRLCRYGALVEVGVGVRPSVAVGLAERDCRVVATDVHERSVPGAVRFVRDDVTDPDLSVYRGADAVYALNCPPELQRPLADVAEAVGTDCLFTTLGGDPTVVDAAPEALSHDTLFRLNT
ncbi:UPF0146 family protein [Natronomonas moolapensis 8.8.11]|uniref:UPF0146 protein Nmlp_1018 n=1 Tax=Natronomonas moolapensis (strain DSM 18674 / CECT 7526 / JCM 14361 / 8.8.11) TaxID=268739 RepID=M1XMX4_NATM8|nr:UPF0146 family protein [Natronomonas moolapensis]CCQ35230.1 UPF0146 family protein [Natronomonas moolapensis 8.8.11]